jgi:hypothetical protein
MPEQEPSPSLKIRTYHSIVHAQSADFFARHCQSVEDAWQGTLVGNHFEQSRAYAIGAVMAAVGYLEALINELFSDSGDPSLQDHFPNVPRETLELMADMWKRDVPRSARYSILEKYEIALALARKPPLDRGRSPYQDVSLLIKLRNTLVHFEPEWTLHSIVPGTDNTRPTRFPESLEGRFPINRLYAWTGNAFFPDKCLGAGCAKWAVKSSVSFAAEFHRLIGFPDRTDYVRTSLKSL